MPPILPKRRYSEADTRKPAGLRESMYPTVSTTPLYAHKEESNSEASSCSRGGTKTFVFHESRFDKPPAPLFKKRASLPGMFICKF